MKLNIIGVLFAAGLGVAVVSPVEADQVGGGLPLASPAAADQGAGHEVDKGQLPALGGNNGPDDALWVLPTVVIAGFAAGYGVRSLVSYRRHRLRLTLGDLTASHRLQAGSEADNPQLSLRLVPRDDVGDLQSPQRPTAARPRQ